MNGSANAEADFAQGRSQAQTRLPGYGGTKANTKLDSCVLPRTTGGTSSIMSGAGARSANRTNVAIVGLLSSHSQVNTSYFSSHTGYASKLDDHDGFSVSIKDVTEAYEHLHGLGMPSEITFDIFKNLITHPSGSKMEVGHESKSDTTGSSKIGVAIISLSKRLVGRQDAHRLRGIIAKAREERAHASLDVKARHVSRIKAPSATSGSGNKGASFSSLDDPMNIASIKRENAYRGLVGGIRKEYKDVQEEMLALDAEKRKLEEEVHAKRRLAFLMNVLEKREAARLARFNGDRGMGVLLSELRKTANNVMKDYDSLIVDLGPGGLKYSLFNNQVPLQREATFIRRNSAWKYGHTTKMLANLHAIHVGRAFLGPMEHATSVGEDVDRTLQQILVRLGVHFDHNEKESMKQKLVQVARCRMERRNMLRLSTQEEHIDDADLDHMHRSVEAKQRCVQEKVDRAAAIGWLCQEYIDLITTFRTETASALSVMLDEEGRRVDGYIDAIKETLVQSEDHNANLNARRNKTFAKEVQNILGTGRDSPAHILEDVRSMIERVAESERLVSQELPMLVPLRSRAGESWVASDESAEKNKKVLERKGNKINYGFELAEEIKTFLIDCKRLK